MNKLLITEDVSKTYGEGFSAYCALNPTSLYICKGTINVIMGKSGSGKSTLLSVMGGIAPPTKGRLIFQGKDFYHLNRKSQAQIRGECFGYVFQSYDLIQELSVYDNICMPLVINKNMGESSYIEDLAISLGIENKLKSFPYQLSGGEQQRVAIARAMVNRPDILFADEPTGNLDGKNSKNVIALLQDLCKQNGQALVIVTHDDGLIENPDQLFLIEDGTVFIQE